MAARQVQMPQHPLDPLAPAVTAVAQEADNVMVEDNVNVHPPEAAGPLQPAEQLEVYYVVYVYV